MQLQTDRHVTYLLGFVYTRQDFLVNCFMLFAILLDSRNVSSVLLFNLKEV